MAVVSYKDTMKRILKNPMRKTFTFLGVTLLLVAVFLMGAIKPTLETIKKIRSEITARERINNQLETKLSNLQTLQTTVRNRREDLEIIDAYFPSNSDYSLILASLEKITARYGFNMSRVSFSDQKGVASTAAYSDMKTVTILLSVSGHPEDITRLLKHLEGLPIVPNVQMVSFSTENSSRSSDSDIVDVAINMQVYRTSVPIINFE